MRSLRDTIANEPRNLAFSSKEVHRSRLTDNVPHPPKDLIAVNSCGVRELFRRVVCLLPAFPQLLLQPPPLFYRLRAANTAIPVRFSKPYLHPALIHLFAIGPLSMQS